MRMYSVLLAGLFLLSTAGWETDFDAAKKKAETEHKYILLNFSGSDWCAPCIRLHDEVFENATFKNFAESDLVLVKADFPRLKKNKLPADQQKKNDLLADKYNSQGIFPYTLLLNPEGKVIKTWEGFPGLTAEQFTDQLKKMISAGK